MGRPAILRVDILADAKGVGRGVSEAEGRFGKLGSTAGKVGRAAAAGLAVAGAAAVGFAYKSIQSASRTEQAFGALDSVYGKNADRVKAWADKAADSVGLARSEYAELSAVVGSQLQNMGVAQDKAAAKSDNLIKVGADLAATFGGSVADAVGAVSSLMRGEADPIERYGVSIKKTDVNARLAAQGLDNLTGKALKQAETQTLLTMLTEQTANSQGAFARESNTLAGQQERLRAKFENLKDTLGQKLLPIATRVLGWVNRLFDGSGKLGGILRNRLGPAFQRVSAFIMGRVVPAARTIYSWFMQKIAPGLQRTLTPIVAGAQRMFGKLRDAVERNRPALEKLLRGAKVLVEFLANRVAPIVGKVVGTAFSLMGSAISRTIGIVARLVGWVSSAISKIQSLIGWVKSIPSIDIPGFGSHGGLALGSRAARHDGGLATGAWSRSDLGWLSSLSPGGAPAVALAGGDTIQITVQGALDPDAVARQIEQLLARRARRVGRR